jgi:hypothetical protein
LVQQQVQDLPPGMAWMSRPEKAATPAR